MNAVGQGRAGEKGEKGVVKSVLAPFGDKLYNYNV